MVQPSKRAKEVSPVRERWEKRRVETKPRKGRHSFAVDQRKVNVNGIESRHRRRLIIARRFTGGEDREKDSLSAASAEREIAAYAEAGLQGLY